MNTLVLDRSRSERGLVLTGENSQQVDIEAALEEGFFVSRDDAPAILTLAQNFIRTKEEHAL